MASNSGGRLGYAKKSNINKTQTFQNHILSKITDVPLYISNLMLHTDINIKTVHEEAITFYKKFHSRFPSHTNLLI